MTADNRPSKTRRQGLAYWMRRVLKESRRAGRGLEEDPVHDLRVALRRCRTIADTFRGLDSDTAAADWRRLRKLARRLFRRVGDLRDVQVLVGWTRKLAPADDPVALTLLGILAERERRARDLASKALKGFDRVEWRSLAETLPPRTRLVPVDGLAFELVALEQCNQAWALHRTALRSRSAASFHRLRIALKKFRYVVENFLPRRHEEWGENLKLLQDALGEANDLDVLWRTLPETGPVFDVARERWRGWVDAEKNARLAAYREKTTGEKPLWKEWRAALPSGRRLERATEAHLIAWARLRGADTAHAQRVTRLSLELYGGLREAGLTPPLPDDAARRILRAASLLHDVGRAAGPRAHHKVSYRLIRLLTPPPGWTPAEIELAAQVARYHRGAEPRLTHKPFAALSTVEQETVRWLGGVLRLGNALDAPGRDGEPAFGPVAHIHVTPSREGIFLRLTPAAGAQLPPAASPDGLLTERKRLLESACHRMIFFEAELPAMAAAS